MRRKTAIVQRRGQRAVIAGELEHEIVEALGGDAGLHVGHQHVERRGGELAGLAHAGEGFGAVQADLPVPAQIAMHINIRHVLVRPLQLSRQAGEFSAKMRAYNRRQKQQDVDICGRSA